MDEIRTRFGRTALTRASTLDTPGPEQVRDVTSAPSRK